MHFKVKNHEKRSLPYLIFPKFLKDLLQNEDLSMVCNLDENHIVYLPIWIPLFHGIWHSLHFSKHK